ncbi:MAG: HEAT repeat domain-containing protein [Acidobacteria bacterium]|nr:HEAT repeat domain-containing protein [Acidobacteriota bacterium]
MRHSTLRTSAFTLSLLALTAAGLLFLPGRGRTAGGDDNDLARLNRFVQSGDSPSMQVFRQGRDLIEREEWAAAAAKFQGYVAQYPKSKEADAALYWLAYAQKKQRKFQDAQQTLERLVKEFPRSTWADDAHAMEVEMGPQTGKSVDPAGLVDDEMKMVALQSLFQSDPARGAAYVSEILKPGSKASRELKEAGVNFLGIYGGPAAASALLDIARTQPDAELRAVAVFRLSQTNDENIVDKLSELYASERDRDVKGQLLRAFSQMNNPRARAKLLEAARAGDDVELRQTAIHWLGQRADDGVVDELLSIYRADRNEDVRGSVLHALSQINAPRARAALLEIARGDADADMRAQAIHALTQFDDAATFEEIIKLYDSERDEDVKGGILHFLSDSKQERALLKLMDVARNDPSREMRKLAIHWLGQTRDPRALKFLQDLLR